MTMFSVVYVCLLKVFIVMNIPSSLTLNIKIAQPCPQSTLNISRFQNKTTSIIMTIDSYGDRVNMCDERDFVVKCFIHKYGNHQTFNIFNDIEFDIHVWKMLKRLALKEPNILIFTNFPKTDMLDKQIVKGILRSKWSLVVIIATVKNPIYYCNDSGMSGKLFTELENFTNELWQRFLIINIVISLPFICPDHYIFYGNKKKFTNSSLFLRTLTLASQQDAMKFTHKGKSMQLTQNYPLKSNIFLRFPTSITDCEVIKNYVPFNGNLSNGYCGLDGLVMADVVKYFGFNITNQGNPALIYGYVDENGRVTGSLGNVVRGEVDVSFNSRFLTFYGVSGFHFLNYISSDSLCALVKKSDEVPIWLFPYDVFSMQLWSLFLMALVIVGVVLWLSAKCSLEFNFKKLTMKNFIMDSLVTGLFGYSSSKSKFLVLKAVCFFASIIFTSTFQGHVNYAYTTLVRYHQINDLQELLDSGAKIYTNEGIISLIKPPYSELHVALLEKMVTGINRTYTDTLLVDNDAALGRRTDMMLLTMKFFTDSRGQPLLHVVDECFRGFYLSIIASKGFPFAEDVRIIIQRLTEAGLPNKYYRWTQQALGLLQNNVQAKNSIPRPTSPVALQDLRLAFGLLVFGHFMGSILFVIECCIKCCSERKIIAQ